MINAISNIISILRMLTPPIIWRGFRKLYHLQRPHYGLNSLDKKLLNYLNYSNGYFIEMGANDGITASNTLFFEKNLNWSGVLIEPIPHKFLECLKNRSTKNAIHCYACTSFQFQDKFVELIYSNTMSISLGLETDIPNSHDHAILGQQFLANGEKIFSFGAKAKTLNQILIDSNAPNIIDFFSLDVEGAEIEILKGIDFKRFQFKYICIESRSFDLISNFLNKHNYKFIEKLSEHDYLFKY